MKTNPESCNEALLTYQSTSTSLKQNENTETNGPKILCQGSPLEGSMIAKVRKLLKKVQAGWGLEQPGLVQGVQWDGV